MSSDGVAQTAVPDLVEPAQHVCIFSRKNLYRITRVVRQAEALSRAGYRVTVYCLGLPHEELLRSTPSTRYVALTGLELDRVTNRQIRSLTEDHEYGALWNVIPYMPSWGLRALKQGGRARWLASMMWKPATNDNTSSKDRALQSSVQAAVTLALKASVRAGLKPLKAWTLRRLARVTAADAFVGQSMYEELNAVDPSKLPLVQLYLAHTLDAHARFAAAALTHIAVDSAAGHPPDLVQAHDRHSLLAGSLVARRYRTPLIFDAVEIYGHQIASAIGPNWLTSAEAIVRSVERPIIEGANQLMTVGESPAQWYSTNFKLSAPAIIVRNARIYVDASADTRLRDDCGVSPGTPLLFTCGIAGPQRGFEYIIELLTHMPEAHAALATEFKPTWEQFRRDLLDRIETLGVSERIHILPMRPPNDLIPYASGADVGLITFPTDSSLSVRLSLPNKFFEMVMARLPIAATDLPNIQLLLAQHGNGCLLHDKDLASAAQSVRELIQKRRTDPSYGRLLEDTAKDLSWNREADVLITAYQSLSTKAKG
jgi:glycosyltransferase involved in cell wall biosynthesis